jgi:hypothetical protein
MSASLFVPRTPELERVLALPRRDWSHGAEELARRVTDLLRSPVACRACGGSREHVKGCELRRIPLSLRPHQAVALVEAAMYQGGLFPIGVGKGKTLIWLLLAYVLESKRPMLVCPAGLIPKAERNWRELAVYWMIPNWLRLISYEVLGRVSAKDELTNFAPDLLGFDEVHRLKSRKAAVTRRIEVHIEHHRTHEKRNKHCRLCEQGIAPMALLHVHDATNQRGRTRLRVVGMSGTITTKSLRDFAHIMHWCVPEHHALPHTFVELDQWRLAIDEGVNVISRIAPGALLEFCDERENDAPDATSAARRGYARRLRETPGIVVTTDDTVRASLSIGHFEAPSSAAIEDAFLRLRGDSSKADSRIILTSQGEVEIPGDSAYSGKRLPDGWALVDGVEVYRHALELSLGFYYIWNPRPPKFWLEARSLWGAFVRRTIKLGKYDSDLDVANHAHQFRVTVDDMLKIVRDDEDAEHEDREIGRRHVYDHWRQVRDTFDRKQQAVRICDSVVKDAAAWLDAHPRGIVWTEHVAFGEWLSEVSGYPYCGQEGRDQQGRLIDDIDGPVIASIRANGTGRDLQFKWDCGRIYTAIAEAAILEQLYARKHREGQDADTVVFEHFIGCVEHVMSFETAMRRARYIEDVGTQPQKLNFADVDVPSVNVIETRPGARWSKDRV